MSDFCVQVPVMGGVGGVCVTAPGVETLQTAQMMPADTAQAFPSFDVSLREPLDRNAQLGAALAKIVDGFSGETLPAIPAGSEAPAVVSVGAVALAPGVETPATVPAVSVAVTSAGAEVPATVPAVPVAVTVAGAEAPATVPAISASATVSSVETLATVARVETVNPQVVSAMPQEGRVSAESVVAEKSALVSESVPVAKVIENPQMDVRVGTDAAPVPEERQKATVAVASSVSKSRGTEGEEVSETPILQALPNVAPVAAETTAVVSETGAIGKVDAVAAVASPSSVSASEAVLEAAHAVADTLLVSPGLLRGEGEMRVQLKPDVLDGSAVNISVTGRTISVSFVPASASSASLLTGHVQELEAHLKQTVVGYEMAVTVAQSASASAQVAGLSGVYAAATASGIGALRGKGDRRG